jgi:lipopolysaccharide/colanic/teichoic acid biosynthesis glycosyltransferase
MPVRRILFLGATPAADEIAGRVQERPELGLNATGYVGREVAGTRLPYLGDDLDSAIESHSPHQIVIGRNTADISVRRLLELQRAGTQVEKLSSLYEEVTGRISLLELAPARLIFSAEVNARTVYVIARNIYSVVIGLVLLAVSSPMLVAAAIMVRLSSGGPIFEHDLRIGLKGSPIKLRRFRDHDRLKWLNRLKLSDFPLLLNVVRGELALIGPAPERPEFAAALRNQIPLYSHRLSVKPGLTGWEQIHRDPKEMRDVLEGLAYDLYYIKHLSPWLDAYIAILRLRSRIRPG